jgi:iron complex outermembrane receptor protein
MQNFAKAATTGLFSAALMCGASLSAQAQAQEQASETTAQEQQGGLSEIVVTATRRTTNVQDVPLAVTAIGGEDLKSRGISDPRQLSGLAPNLNVDQGQGEGQTHVSIRGQASTSFGLEANSPAAIYLDDVYQPFQFGIGTQIFDLNRIEVLRGPQGTLFGKNTTAGSVNYFSQTPTRKDEGYLTLDGGGGDFGRYAVEGVYNKVLGSTLAARASFRVEHRDTYIDNLFDGSKLGEYDNYAGRIQLAWTPSDDTTVNLKLFGLRHKGDGPIYISRGYFFNPCDIGLGPYYSCDANNEPFPVGNNSAETYSPIDTGESFDNYGVTLKIDQALGDFALTSISNWQEGHYRVATDDDGMFGDFFHSRQRSKAYQISQEFRLATPDDKPLRAILGVYGQYDKISTDQGSMSSLLDPNGIDAFGFSYLTYEYAQLRLGTTATTTLAGFASLTYDFSDAFSITGGLRYSNELKNAVSYRSIDIVAGLERDVTDQFFDFDYALTQVIPGYDVAEDFSGKRRYEKVTWDVTANFKPSEDALLYAKVGTGFRSGGFFPAPAGAGSIYITLLPETVTSYELGFKTEWLDRKLRINGAAYYVDYKDLQIQTANVSGSGLGFSNAAAARVKGLELEVEAAPATGLTLSGSLGYNKAVYRDYSTLVGGVLTDLSGNTLPYASRWTANLAGNYVVPVDAEHQVSFNTNWSYRTKYFFDSFEDPATTEPSRWIGNARISFGKQDGGWELAAYVNNLLNEDVRGFSFVLPAMAPTIYAPRRTWGLQGTFRF